MTRARIPLLLFVTLLSWTAWGGSGEISALEQQRALLERHQTRLESLLDEQSKRVTRLKGQPAGVGRDYQLQAALRESQALATRLTQLRAQLRSSTQKLAAEYGDASKRAATTSERARYQKLRAQLLEKRGQDTRIVTRERVGRLDSPEDLDEKADLLQDSEEKVRRQLKQVEVRIAQLENRARLRRHGKALDDNPFVEESPRRTGQARRSSTPTASASGGSSASDPSSEAGGRYTAPAGKMNSAAPPPSRTADDDTAFAGSGSSAAAKAPAAPDGWGRPSEVIISIRDVMDPAILKDPKLGGKGEDLKGHLSALRKAGERLRQVVSQLSSQTRELRSRAKALRTQK